MVAGAHNIPAVGAGLAAFIRWQFRCRTICLYLILNEHNCRPEELPCRRRYFWPAIWVLRPHGAGYYRPDFYCSGHPSGYGFFLVSHLDVDREDVGENKFRHYFVRHLLFRACTLIPDPEIVAKKAPNGSTHHEFSHKKSLVHKGRSGKTLVAFFRPTRGS